MKRTGSFIALAASLLLAVSTCARTEPTTPTPTAMTAKTSAPSAAPAPEVTAAPSVSAAPSVTPDEPTPWYPDTDTRPPLPAGFVRIAESGTTTCASFRVDVIAPRDPAGVRSVKVTGPDGKAAYEARGRSYAIEQSKLEMDLWGEFCGDLTGDGVPEIVLSERTIGAHCCYTRHVISMTSPPRRLLMWEKGDAGTDIVPVKYGSGPAWQIEDLVVLWPPFDVDKGDPVLSYASAPLVPVVFSLVGGEYKMTSLSFPEAYRKNRSAIRAECAGSDSCDGDIIAWIDSLVIGDWHIERKNVKDVALRAALDRVSAATKRQLATDLGSLSRPASPRP